MINDSNCRNCGAPVAPGESCEYCGTPHPVPVQSSIRMTPDSITLVCDTLQIGKFVQENDPAITGGRVARRYT